MSLFVTLHVPLLMMLSVLGLRSTQPCSVHSPSLPNNLPATTIDTPFSNPILRHTTRHCAIHPEMKAYRRGFGQTPACSPRTEPNAISGSQATVSVWDPARGGSTLSYPCLQERPGTSRDLYRIAIHLSSRLDTSCRSDHVQRPWSGRRGESESTLKCYRTMN